MSRPQVQTIPMPTGNSHSSIGDGSVSGAGNVADASQTMKPARPSRKKQASDVGGGETSKSSGGRRRADAAHELAAQLTSLRDTVHLMVQRYELNVGGSLDALIERAQGGNAELEGKPRLPTLRQIAAARKVMEELQLKPGKGRSKDFGRVERAVEALEDVLES